MRRLLRWLPVLSRRMTARWLLVRADFTNVADVTGDDPNGVPVEDSDDAAVDVINPAIAIEKTPDSQQARSGDTVTFTIVVTNTGDVDLTDVEVTDAVAPACDNVIGCLAVWCFHELRLLDGCWCF